jgi:hypothetical protein
LNDEIKEAEMGMAHSTHGEKRNACSFDWKPTRKEVTRKTKTWMEHNIRRSSGKN